MRFHHYHRKERRARLREARQYWREQRHIQYHLQDRYRHSLGARLMTTFLMLAAAASGVVYLVMSHHQGWGWALAGFVLMALFAYKGIRHLLHPLRALGQGAAAFGQGDFKHRIPIYHRDEIADLADRFNRMADDIQAMLDAKRELLLAISHELRSPLTRARLNAELIDSDSPSMSALLKELGLMRTLIEDLLERERLDAGHSALRLQDCDVRVLITELLRVRYAQPWSDGLIQLELGDGLPEKMRLDNTRLQLLLGNLLDNALRYNDALKGPVVLSATVDSEGVCFSVRDHGPGVPADQLAQLGQPFFRPDSARSRDSGGVGLGLNLCRLIAEAHGGRLVLRNVEGGFEAVVVLSVTRA